MSSLKNTSLKNAVTDLSQVLNSSLGSNQECVQAITAIEEIINSIEVKLNGLPATDLNDSDAPESFNFAPETVASKV
jgi:hypothetical protein